MFFVSSHFAVFGFNVFFNFFQPLASFATGLEDIQLSMDKCHQLQESESLPPATVPLCQSIQATIANIRNTQAFMLMTINRCLDYTKASQGLKLIPHQETIDLTEALKFPVDCMKNIQSRIPIRISALPSVICPFIISDKQWLQENILCLLSNAIKYSADGAIDIHISLEQHDESPLLPPVVDDGIQQVAAQVAQSSIHSNNSSRTQQGNNKHVHSNRSKSQSFSLRSMTSQRVTPTDATAATYSELSNIFLRIEVEDSGIGMTEEAMTSLFSPFKQTQRLAGGTGLGLYSLSKRLDALHGFYGVKKRRDGKQGSLFWLEIPYKPDIVYAHHNIMTEEDAEEEEGGGGESVPSKPVWTRSNECVGVVTEESCCCGGGDDSIGSTTDTFLLDPAGTLSNAALLPSQSRADSSPPSLISFEIRVERV
jgi:signal transduction histidine kinase